MTRDEIEPFDPELDALLGAERDAPAPNDALARVWSRLAVGGVGGSGEGSAATGAGAGRALASRIAFVGIAAFIAGGAVGAGLVLATRSDKERIVYVERPARPSAPTAERAPPLAPTVESASATSSPPVAPASAPSPSPATSASLLSRERAILDAARSALSAGESARALSLLDDHARRFAHPQLGEEREALGIQALVTSGRYDDARARAARFRASSPASLFLPAIDASLASIP